MDAHKTIVELVKIRMYKDFLDKALQKAIEDLRSEKRGNPIRVFYNENRMLCAKQEPFDFKNAEGTVFWAESWVDIARWAANNSHLFW